MRSGAMLEDVHALPRAQAHASTCHRYRKLREGERGSDMRGHVVRSFGRVYIEVFFLGDKAIEKPIQVVDHVGVGILLNGERGRRVLDEYGQEPGMHGGFGEPLRKWIGDLVESLAVRRDSELMGKLLQIRATQP